MTPGTGKLRHGDTEKAEIDWLNRTPEERLAEVDRLRQEQMDLHPEWPRGMERVLRLVDFSDL